MTIIFIRKFLYIGKKIIPFCAKILEIIFHL